MYLVHKKGLAKDGEAPVLLYAYGGFNVSLLPGFMRSIWPWLEAGGVFAVPNLRGGGELGEAWHQAGMLHHKQNVFDDFAAAARYLVKEGWTKPGHLAADGASNGGLLVGVAMVQEPDLFGAIACGVPLVDMLRYHLFGSGKTWIPEYGDPAKKEDFDVLAAYSPYHAVKKGTEYPALLMLSSDHDDRVDPMHARKFVAAIQGSGSSNPAWLRIEANSGHSGADLVRQAVQENADQYAFLMSRFNMKYPPVEEPATGAPGAAPEEGGEEAPAQ
jgi:prolyl oligopeptidase